MSFFRNVLTAALIGGTLVSVGCTALTEKEPQEIVTDAAIVTRAKALLAVDPVVKARNINVTAVKGVVTLAGVVKSPEEAQRAVELVSGIRGVTSVASVLQVLPG